MADKENNLSFEEMLEQLEKCVSILQTENITLEEQLRVFTQGVELVGRCQEQLKNAENKIKLLTQNANRIVLQDTNFDTPKEQF